MTGLSSAKGRFLLLVMAVSTLMGGSREVRAAGWEVLTLEAKPGQVSSPWGVAVDVSGSLYVADTGNHRIQRRDPQGDWSVLATRGSDPGQVDAPTGVAVDASGSLYVADRGNHRIQRRDPEGNWTILATHGSDPGQVLYPKGLAVDGSDRLYVTDTRNSRIQRYTPPAVMLGDLNGDAKVNVQDATLSLRIAVGSLTPSDAQRAAGDVNGDGRWNVQDTTLILREAVGSLDKFPGQP